jgi:hypothetical protein
MNKHVILAGSLCVAFAGPAFASKIIGNGKPASWAIVTTANGCAVRLTAFAKPKATIVRGYATRRSAKEALATECKQFWVRVPKAGNRV